MDLKKIKDLLKIVSESGLSEVEIEDENLRVVVRAAPREVTVTQPIYTQPQAPPPTAPVPPPPAAAPPTPAVSDTSSASSESGFIQKAPIVGTFYKAPSPDADPFVKVGDTIQKGDVICIIEAMKLMNEIEAESGGTIEKILVQNAEPVEYDQPLFIIKPD